MSGRTARAAMALASASVLAACSSLLDSRQGAGLCGDNVKQTWMGEECDDGNLVSGDGCSAACLSEECGNGRLDPGEECDNGKANDDAGDCTTVTCRLARCGDGKVKTHGTPPYERCDDGNEVNGDGCSPDCAMRGAISILAGTPGGRGSADGVGSAARFAGIRGVAVRDDVLYFADHGSCAVRAMDLWTGRVSTIAGQLGKCRHVVDGGPGVGATFAPNPHPIAIVGEWLYLPDGQFLRRVDLASPAHSVQTCITLAEDDPNRIEGLASNPASPNELYMTRVTGVYRMTLPCDCAPMSGTGSPCPVDLVAGGFTLAKAVATDPDRKKLYVGDLTRIYAVDLDTHQRALFAGSVAAADGTNTVVEGLTYDAGFLYSVDQMLEGDPTQSYGTASLGWGIVRRFDASASPPVAERLVGASGSLANAGATGESDGFGSFARLVNPWTAAVWNGTLLVGADASIRALSLSSGQLALSAGTLVQDFQWYDAQAVAVGAGRLYAASYAGEVFEFDLGSSKPIRRVGTCDVAASGAAHVITGMVLDQTMLYVSDATSGKICQVDLAGVEGIPCCPSCAETCSAAYTSPDAMQWVMDGLRGLAYDGQAFYVSKTVNQTVVRIDRQDGSVRDVDIGASLTLAAGLVYVEPYLFVALPEANQVVRVNLAGSGVTTLGTGDAQTLDSVADAPGPGVARFCHPWGLATDGKKLFVGEGHCPESEGRYHGHAIRQVDLASLRVSTLTGPGPRPYVVEGVGHLASVNRPAALAYDAVGGALYVADAWDNVLLRIE